MKEEAKKKEKVIAVVGQRRAWISNKVWSHPCGDGGGCELHQTTQPTGDVFLAATHTISLHGTSLHNFRRHTGTSDWAADTTLATRVPPRASESREAPRRSRDRKKTPEHASI
ncbi:hypothetical protein E2C01_058527 [Portunus trituberculatus]|uniref:Uncharacterized protein n=1 Tax=Portunus trituberculatus TaxID=210409 RepID=A0A5B7GVT9_PORTR|nr:hypothetical protein [Portunus trituberculatus]